MMQATLLQGRPRSLLIFIADGSGIFREDIYFEKKIYLDMVQHTYLEMVYISALDSREAKTYPEGSCPHSYARRLAGRWNFPCPRSYASAGKDAAR